MQPMAVDLFAGAGGATQGLRNAGFDVVVAVENDVLAAETWSLNHPGTMLVDDIRKVSPTRIMEAGGFAYGELDLLKACPPCQGFSSLRGRTSPDSDRNDLVLDTLRIVEGLGPRSILIENVPGLRTDSRFDALLDGLHRLGYQFQDYIVQASDLGVPQRRRRLVVVALKSGAIIPANVSDLIPEHLRRSKVSAGQALAELTNSLSTIDPVHVWRRVKGQVGERIRAIPVGGTRFDLPEHLELACHQRLLTPEGKANRSATGSYGRVRLDEPAPTMTTRCTTPACGSFIHPVENRGLSLREAASFQTFPPTYKWAGSYGAIERQIGNAVPVVMAEALGGAVLRQLNR